MRISVLCASGALVASFAFSACSGGSGTPAVPSGQQSAASMGRPGQTGHLVPVVRRATQSDYEGACPPSSSYFACYYVYPGTSFSQEWEEEYSTGSMAGQAIPGTWHWHMSHAAKAANGKRYSLIQNLGWSPNPANPSTNTVSVSSSVPPSNGAAAYYFNLSVCSNNSPYGKG